MGETISVTVTAGTINNPFSVAAANAAALAQATAGAAASRIATPCLYPNEEQTCTETCPDGTLGDDVSVTISAGEFFATTQEEANALALASACALAADQRILNPCGEPALSVSLLSSWMEPGLIGFEEFTDISTPPKKYKQRNVDGNMQMKDYWQTADCNGGSPGCGDITCVPSGGYEFTNYPIPPCGSIDGFVRATELSRTETHVTFLLESECFVAGTSTPSAHSISFYDGGGGGDYPSGTEVVVPMGAITGVAVISHPCGVTTVGTPTCIIAGAPPSVDDAWEIEESYGEDGVLVRTTDITSSTTNTGSVSPIPERQDATAVADGRPDLHYIPRSEAWVYSHYQVQPVYTEVTTERVQRLTDGLGCVVGIPFAGPASTCGNGLVIELLSDEDTEAEAIARATPSIGTAAVAFYEARTGFTFEYQTVTLDFDLVSLSVGENYTITVNITTEDYGGGNAVASQLSYPFNAPSSTYSFSQEIAAEKGKQITVGSATLS